MSNQRRYRLPDISSKLQGDSEVCGAGARWQFCIAVVLFPATWRSSRIPKKEQIHIDHTHKHAGSRHFAVIHRPCRDDGPIRRQRPPRPPNSDGALKDTGRFFPAVVATNDITFSTDGAVSFVAAKTSNSSWCTRTLNSTYR